MTDARKLFKSGKRYRGFAQLEGYYTPVSFNVYVVSRKEIRLRYIFPISVADNLDKGNIIYALVEDGDYYIAELRVVGKDSRSKAIMTSLDFVTKDRRKLPRVRLKGVLNVEAELSCEEGKFKGMVLDMSMASLSVDIDKSVASQECDVNLFYKGQKVYVKGRVVKSAGALVLEMVEGGSKIANFLGRLYSDLFLKTQRGS